MIIGTTINNIIDDSWKFMIALCEDSISPKSYENFVPWIFTAYTIYHLLL